MGIFTRGETETIRRHRLDTTCFLVAEEEESVRLAQERTKAVTGRRLKHVGPVDLPGRLPRSFLVAVLHAPGLDIARLADWAKRLTLAQQERATFYEMEAYPRDDAARALRPWMRAGLSAPVRRRCATEAELIRLLGNDLNWRILEDHTSDPRRSG